MKRREFITVLGGAAATWPIAARAQQRPLPVIGYLDVGSPEMSAHLVPAFRKGLSDAGFVEGRNVAIEYRWARNELDRLPELAADLVRRRVALIVATGSPQAPLAAKAVTTTIPVVFGYGGDPVRSGLVASCNRPGSNVTGVVTMNVDLIAKRVGLLHELLPRATRFAMLNNVSGGAAENAVVAAASFGAHMEVFAASTNSEINAAFASLAAKQVEALVVNAEVLFLNRRAQVITLAARYAVPTIYSSREFGDAGGLISYGSSFTDMLRQTGIYAARVLKGEKPADLPVLRPTKFELVINLQTAQALDLDVPPTLLATADEVIE